MVKKGGVKGEGRRGKTRPVVVEKQVHHLAETQLIVPFNAIEIFAYGDTLSVTAMYGESRLVTLTFKGGWMAVPLRAEVSGTLPVELPADISDALRTGPGQGGGRGR